MEKRDEGQRSVHAVSRHVVVIVIVALSLNVSLIEGPTICDVVTVAKLLSRCFRAKRCTFP